MPEVTTPSSAEVTSIISTIEQRRKARGLTQKALADELGIRQSTLSQIENGRMPHTSILEKLCRYFHCQIGDLFYIQ